MGDIINALLPDGERRSGEDRRTTDQPMPEFLGELDARRFPRRADDENQHPASARGLSDVDVNLLLAQQCRKMANDTQNLETRQAFLEMAEDYEKNAESKGAFIIRTTADLIIAEAQASAVCRSCSHTKVVPVTTLQDWFPVPVRLDKVGSKLRCPKCGNKGARIDPFFPEPCEGESL